MAQNLHSKQINNHIIEAWTYADAATRLAAGGFTSTDLGKVAYQSDTKTYWRLTATSPTWIQVAGGHAAIALPIDNFTTVGSGDDFIGTSLDGSWSSLQSTTLTSNDRSVDGYLIQKNTGNTGGQERGLKRTFSPAGDFTVFAKLNYATIATNYNWAGVFVGASNPSDSAGGNRLQLHIYHNNGVWRLKFAKMASGVETVIIDAVVNASTPPLLISGPQFPIWYKISRTGSTLTASISFDGIYFIDMTTTTTISYTVATIGVYIAESSATTDIVGVWDYIATTG